MTQNDEITKREKGVWSFLGLLILMTVLWAASGWLINRYYGGDVAKRSSFGEMFGAINALFTGAALAGVIISISLQRNELALQRKELELTRDELRRTAAAQERIVKLSAYTALANAHAEVAYRIQDILVNRYGGENEELHAQFTSEINSRNYYIKKLRELAEQK